MSAVADAEIVLALDEALGRSTLRSAYQPIVDLETGAVVAHEALVRGPAGSLVETPGPLFSAARRAGRLAELDWACRAAAVSGAFDVGLGRSGRLFINVEPDTLATPCPPSLRPLWDRSAAELDIVVELTERALTDRPADLLHAVSRMRQLGWGVALDDVGADVRSLALMPLLRPDVIKLDLRVVQEKPSAQIAEIVNAVNAERERSGAVILAEGIETVAHLRAGRALGATLGQGWLFGRPGPLPAPDEPVEAPPHIPGLPEFVSFSNVSPYEVVSAVRDVRRADKRLLLSMSLHLEEQALSLGEAAVVVSAFQSAERFTPATRERYRRLAESSAFVAALGAGMEVAPAPGVRGAALAGDDVLRGEWSVVVLGPHFAGALVARDLGDGGPEHERRFDVALTYDRDLVIEAAGALMRRVPPLAG
jgi:EAL domain-containing protein (putative c-di-GMP-specific phosphodiesterase class I)